MVNPHSHVTVRLVGILRTTTGIDKVQFTLQEGETIGTILKRLVEKYPELNTKIFDKVGTLHTYLNIIVEDKPIREKNLDDVPIQKPVTLTLLMAIGGG